jgi:DNA-binding MarR family transcriptional regulator
MLTEDEITVLELLNSRLLAKLSEIKADLGNEHDGVRTTIQRLISMDCVKVIEPIGEKCYVITHKGSKILREAKNPERRAQVRTEMLSH